MLFQNEVRLGLRILRIVISLVLLAVIGGTEPSLGTGAHIISDQNG